MADYSISTVLWRGKWLILVSIATAIVLAVLITKQSAKVYEGTAVLQVNAAATTSQAQGVNDVQQASQVLAATDATLIETRSFLAQIRPNVLGGTLSTGELQSRISASAVTGTALVSLKATAPSADEASRLALAVASAFVDSVRSTSEIVARDQQNALQERIATISGQIRRTKDAADAESLRTARAALQAQLANLIANGIQQDGSVRVTAPATAPPSPIRPRPLLNLVAGALLGLIAGVGLSWLRLRLDRGLHSGSEAEQILDVPLLASIPVRRRFSRDDAVLGEAYDVLRANLAFISVDRPLQVLTVSSFNPREGKTSTVEGLAYAAARGGISVAVVDADVRTRTLTTRFEQTQVPGLTNVVVGSQSLDDVLVELEGGISFLPSGPTPPNPPSLLASRQLRDVVETLRTQFSLVLIDSPPVAHLADASILASISDGVVVVARVGVTARVDLATAAANLRHSPTPIVGVVVLERRQIDETYYPALAKGTDGTAQVTEPAESV
jgi:capsular exopolysaccharide synthesis family protein